MPAQVGEREQTLGNETRPMNVTQLAWRRQRFLEEEIANPALDGREFHGVGRRAPKTTCSPEVAAMKRSRDSRGPRSSVSNAKPPRPDKQKPPADDFFVGPSG